MRYARYILPGALALFLLLAFLVYQDQGRAFGLDLVLARAVQSIPGAGFETFMELVSLPGHWLLLAARPVLLASLGLWLPKHRLEAYTLLLSLVGGQALNLALKIALHRPRPTPDLVIVWIPQLQGYSFPSGHVMHYVSFYGCL